MYDSGIYTEVDELLFYTVLNYTMTWNNSVIYTVYIKPLRVLCMVTSSYCWLHICVHPIFFTKGTWDTFCQQVFGLIPWNEKLNDTNEMVKIMPENIILKTLIYIRHYSELMRGK